MGRRNGTMAPRSWRAGISCLEAAGAGACGAELRRAAARLRVAGGTAQLTVPSISAADNRARGAELAAGPITGVSGDEACGAAQPEEVRHMRMAAAAQRVPESGDGGHADAGDGSSGRLSAADRIVCRGARCGALGCARAAGANKGTQVRARARRTQPCSHARRMRGGSRPERWTHARKHSSKGLHADARASTRGRARRRATNARRACEGASDGPARQHGSAAPCEGRSCRTGGMRGACERA
eukprot:2829739-Pleurochrysis_carterae.AAC.2